MVEARMKYKELAKKVGRASSRAGGETVTGGYSNIWSFSNLFLIYPQEIGDIPIYPQEIAKWCWKNYNY